MLPHKSLDRLNRIVRLILSEDLQDWWLNLEHTYPPTLRASVDYWSWRWTCHLFCYQNWSSFPAICLHGWPVDWLPQNIHLNFFCVSRILLQSSVFCADLMLENLWVQDTSDCRLLSDRALSCLGGQFRSDGTIELHCLVSGTMVFLQMCPKVWKSLYFACVEWAFQSSWSPAMLWLKCNYQAISWELECWRRTSI